MKLQQKTKVYHKVNVWASISINGLATALITYFIMNDNKIIIIGVAAFIAFSSIGFSKVRVDIALNDLSNMSVILDYVCASAIYVLYAYVAYYVTDKVIAILPAVIAMILEWCVAIIIAYRYKILNKIKPRKNK